MRLLIIIISISLLSNCAKKSNDFFLPKEYTYPIDSIGEGKTFIYKNDKTGEQTYEDYKVIESGGQKSLSVLSYHENGKSDSAIMKDGRRVEEYNFFFSGNPPMIKGKIIQDTVIKDGGKFGKYISVITYNSDSLIRIVSSTETYIKDTSILWNGISLPSLLMQGEGTINITSTDTSVSLYSTSNFYYAKGIGLIRYTIAFKDHLGNDNYSVWELDAINKISN
jgi:hypothetical protein